MIIRMVLRDEKKRHLGNVITQLGKWWNPPRTYESGKSLGAYANEAQTYEQLGICFTIWVVKGGA